MQGNMPIFKTIHQVKDAETAELAIGQIVLKTIQEIHETQETVPELRIAGPLLNDAVGRLQSKFRTSLIKYESDNLP